MKKTLSLLTLFCLILLGLASCNNEKSELKKLIAQLNTDCPIPLGSIGQMDKADYKSDKVTFYYTIVGLDILNNFKNNQEAFHQFMLDNYRNNSDEFRDRSGHGFQQFGNEPRYRKFKLRSSTRIICTKNAKQFLGRKQAEQFFSATGKILLCQINKAM